MTATVGARAESYRDDRDVPIQDKGVAIVVTSRFALFKHAWTDASDDARVQLAPPGLRTSQDDEVLRRVCPLLSR